MVSAGFTGVLGTNFTARIDDGGSANVNPGNTLTVTLPTGVPPSNPYIGVGTHVCPPVGSSAFTCFNVTALGTGLWFERNLYDRRVGAEHHRDGQQHVR